MVRCADVRTSLAPTGVEGKTEAIAPRRRLPDPRTPGTTNPPDRASVEAVPVAGLMMRNWQEKGVGEMAGDMAGGNGRGKRVGGNGKGEMGIWKLEMGNCEWEMGNGKSEIGNG